MVQIVPSEPLASIYYLLIFVQSGNPPDCYPASLVSYPYSVEYEDLFESVDDVLDFSDELWNDGAYTASALAREGKTYIPPVGVNIRYLLFYRTSVIKEHGLEDPWELYEKGEWTWSKFVEMSESFVGTQKNKYAVDGEQSLKPFLTTTGVPIIGTSNGKLVSNFKNPDISECVEMLTSYGANQKMLFYPKQQYSFSAPSPQRSEWVEGNTLFYVRTISYYERLLRLYKNREGRSDDEIAFVPSPTPDGKDTAYREAYISNSYMLVKGSENKEAYKAWIYSNLLLTQDESYRSRYIDSYKEKYDYTDELIERYEKVNAPGAFTPVFDHYEGYFDGRGFFNEHEPYLIFERACFCYDGSFEIYEEYIAEIEKEIDNYGKKE